MYDSTDGKKASIGKDVNVTYTSNVKDCSKLYPPGKGNKELRRNQANAYYEGWDSRR